MAATKENSCFLVPLSTVSPEHIKATHDVLTGAFSNYPVISLFSPDETMRRDFMSVWFPTVSGIFLPHEWVLVAGVNEEDAHSGNFLPKAIVGHVTVYRTTDASANPYNFQYFWHGLWRVFWKFPWEVVKRAGAEIGALEKEMEVDGTKKHDRWVVEYVAVSEREQGKGYGSTMLKKAIEIFSARENIPFDLITHKPENVRLYERMGFAVRRGPVEVTAAGGVFTHWHMVREAIS